MEERGCAREERTGGVGGPFEKLRSSLWSEVNVSTGSTVRQREKEIEKGGEMGGGWKRYHKDIEVCIN